MDNTVFMTEVARRGAPQHPLGIDGVLTAQKIEEIVTSRTGQPLGTAFTSMELSCLLATRRSTGMRYILHSERQEQDEWL